MIYALCLASWEVASFIAALEVVAAGKGWLSLPLKDDAVTLP
jgi:hypothetical protein